MHLSPQSVLDAISEATNQLSRATTLSSLREAISKYVLSMFECGRGLLVELNDDGETLQTTGLWNYPPEFLKDWKRIPLSWNFPLTNSFRESRPIFIESQEELYTIYPDFPLLHGSKPGAVVALPLIVNGRAIAAIGLLYEKNISFPDQTRKFMQSLATHCAEAIHRVILFQKVKSTQEQLALALEASEMGIWDWHPESNRVEWSDRLQGIFGLKSGVFNGTFEHYQELVHPDDRAQLNAVIQSSIAKRKPFEVVHRVTWPDGSNHWVEGRGKPFFNEKGELFRMTGTLINIDEKMWSEDALKNNEERFRALVEQTPFPFLLYNKEGLCTYANPAWERFWESRRVDLMNGYNILKDPHIKMGKLEDLASRAFNGETVIFPDVYYDPAMSGKVGRPRWVRVHFFPVKDPFGNLKEVAQVCEDVTDGVELKEAVRVRDEFLQIASHELKTPLTSLKLQTQMTKRNMINKGDEFALSQEKSKRLVEQVDRQVSRLSHLVDDMLDISRISTGRFVLRLEEFEMGELIEEVVERLAPLLDQAMCDVKINVSEKIMGTWDRYRMEQVLTNLLTNAARYGEGTPIEVSARMDGEMVELKVKDFGRGISKSDQERIFKRYERVHQAEGVSGLGLGLFIVMQILDRHGGGVVVESEPGKGALFIVKVPVNVS